MSRSCKTIGLVFLLLYLSALGLLAVGTFGWFGADKDPLSAVYLVPLGFPWTLLVGNAPEPLVPWLAIAAPAVNLALVVAICRLVMKSSSNM